MIFTSGFGCPATAAARRQGLVPIRRVLANVVLQPAVQIHPRSRGRDARGGVRELTVWSDLRQSGRATALRRLSAVAMDAGADGVVSVRLTQRRVPRLEGIEILAEGTAVSGLAAQSVAPVLTSLGPPELNALDAAGYRPLGLLVEAGVWAIVPGKATVEAYRPELGRRNFEHPDFTAGLNEIRRGILARLRSQARDNRACAGVIGIELGLGREHDDRAGASLIVSADALGTPIAAVRHTRTSSRIALELGGRVT